MKTPEQIRDRIDRLSKYLPEGDYELAYLNLALQKDEFFLKSLLMKYEFEVKEDSAILRALHWVLEDEKN